MIQLVVNAVVRTLDDSLPLAQALAVKDGRIVEVGGTDEILWLREGDYEVVDLGGRTVIPGFVDPHNHFSIGAYETLWADCRSARTVFEVQQARAPPPSAVNARRPATARRVTNSVPIVVAVTVRRSAIRFSRRLYR